jgi:tetratricopeptide (TPR) repeat protein
MRPNNPRFAWIAVLVASAAISTACNKTSGNVSASASSDGGKIPVSTRSEDARNEFLQGRALSDKLLGQESLQHFDKAIALDPEFASAELARANNSPTPKEFFEHLNKAVSLSEKSSEGERLLILSNQAGANGDTVKQEVYLKQLIAAYPNDERAQFSLANYYFGQQDYMQSVEHYKKATELAPNFSPAYNVLGYSYKQQGDYVNAEQAFKKYIELIPNDPNPYDSYAELLLKMGRFDDSIMQYQKALSVDPHFAASHFGMAGGLLYQGKSEEAQAELQKMAQQARNDGELRTALFGMAVVAADSGKFEQAAQQIDREYAVAEKKNDAASMAADLQAKGNILVEMLKYDAAGQQFDRSLQIIQTSNLSQGVKDNATLQHHFNLAGLAIAKKDYSAAKTHAEEFRKGAETNKNDLQLKQGHELAGRIALAEKNYDIAIAELQQANQQNPRNLYRLAQAYQAKGDSPKAQEYYTQAAGFNPLPQLNYAFIRLKAQKLAAGSKA